MNFTINLKSNESKPVKEGNPIVFGIIFLLVGILLSFFAYKSIVTYNNKNKTFIETKSIVVDYKSNDEGLQAIVVEYEVNRVKYTKISNTFSNMPAELGTEVSVKYNPNNPKDAIWTKDSNNIILPIAGGLFTVIGLVLLITGIKKKSNQALVTGVPDQQVVNQNPNEALVTGVPDQQIVNQNPNVVPNNMINSTFVAPTNTDQQTIDNKPL